jgi:hypothetical protein
VGQGLLCLAAEQQAGYAAPAVRAHDDEIAALRRGRVENGLVGMSIARMRCIAETPADSAMAADLLRSNFAACAILASCASGGNMTATSPPAATADQRGVTLRTVTFAPMAFASPIACVSALFDNSCPSTAISIFLYMIVFSPFGALAESTSAPSASSEIHVNPGLSPKKNALRMAA